MKDQQLYSLYRKVVGWTLLVLVACLLWIFSSDYRNDFIDPGTLTASHSGVKECTSCHVSADQSALDWLHTAISATNPQDSQLCMNCHALGDNAMFAHGVQAATLIKPSSKQLSGDLHSNILVKTAQTLNWTPGPEDQLECKACHQEHSGNHKLITADSANHCQSCHKQSFDSFESGHPEFSNFPFQSPTSLAFDHRAHLQKYFADEKLAERAPKNCLDCHSPSEHGNEIETKGFEPSCASCHAKDIVGSSRATASGIEIFAVPGLDQQTLTNNGYFIGHWPTGADAELSPFLELLLQSDEHYATVKPILGSVDLMDLRNATSEQQQATVTLAWCIKMLLNGINKGGALFLQQRLEQALDRTLSNSELSALVATLPRAVVSEASENWFPTLVEDLKEHEQSSAQATAPLEKPSLKAGQEAEISEPKADNDDILFVEEIGEEELFAEDDSSDDLWDEDDLENDAEETGSLSLSSEDWAKVGGWYRDGLALYYRPAAHTDRFIRHWLDLSANLPAAKRLYEQLSDEGAPGRCLGCHTVTAGDDGLFINWLAGSNAQSETQSSRFTVFRHSPHLNMLDETGCQTCHALRSDEELSASETKHSNFSPLSKSQCDSCHNDSVPLQNCLSCHRYHANTLGPMISAAEFLSK